MTRSISFSKVGGATVVAVALLVGNAAIAQQPPPPQPAPLRVQPPPGGAPGLPMGHPAIQPPSGLAPPGARPLRPPPTPHVAPVGAQKGPEAGGGGHAKGGHCPGHGPLDAPHAPNWWHGMLMVNNERAKQGGFVNKLLFRYHNEANPCDEKNEPPPFLASLLNFGLLAFILARFGKKPIAEALVKRKQSIMQEIDNATRLRDEAEGRLRTYEDKFERMEETLEELKVELALQAEVEKKHLLSEAEERRVRMKRDAEFRIEQELKSAKAELLAASVQSAVLAAEELLKKSANAQDQDRMMKEYLSVIPAAIKGGSSSSGVFGGST